MNMDLYSSWVLNNKKWMLILLLLLTSFFIFHAVKLKVNATPYFLDDSHPSRQADEKVKNTFSNSGEVMMVATVTEQDDIFNMTSLTDLYHFTLAIENLTLTDERDIEILKSLSNESSAKRVINRIIENGLEPSDKNLLPRLNRALSKSQELSLKNEEFIEDLATRLRPVRKIRNVVRIESIKAIDDELDIHPLMYNLPKTAEELQSLKEEALNNPLVHNIVFSRKSNAVNNFIELNILQDDAPNMRRFYSAVVETIKTLELTDQYHLGGPPAIFAQTSTIIKSDSDKLFPAIFLVVMTLLYILFKDIRSVLLPMVVAILSVLWTLGSMSMLGYKQNLVSTIMPVFLISIGVADSIHYLTEYRRQKLTSNHKESLKLALIHLWKPMFMTTITTIVGFLSLAYTEIGFIKEFGLFVALGVLYAYLLTISLLPTILGALSPKEDQVQSSTNIDRLINKMVHWNSYIVLKKAKSIYLISACLVIPITFAIHNLQVDNQMIGYFDEDSKIYQDNEIIKEYFAGASSVEFTIKSTTKDYFTTPESLKLIEKIEERLLATPHVNAVYSLAGFLKLVNREVTDRKSESYRIPYDNPALIPQYYLLYESSNGDDINGVIEGSYQQSRLVVFIDTDQTSKVTHIVDSLVEFVNSENNNDLTISPSGFGNVLINTRNEVISSQVFSLGLSFLGILILLSLLFRSIKIGIVGIVPLTFTVLINFSFMSWMGLFLDVGTAIVAPIAIGVGVDYAIYFLNSVKRHQLALADINLAIKEAITELYRPIGFNTVVLGFGFLVLNLSSHESLIHLGMLISGTMLFSAIITLTLLPVLTRSLNLFPATVNQSLNNANDSHMDTKQLETP